MESKQEKVDLWEKEGLSLPIFFQPWYLDITAGEDNWSYLSAVGNSDQIEAVWPISREKKWGLSLSRMPVLTPYLGPFIKPSLSEKNHSVYSREQKLHQALLNQLPDFHYLKHKWHPSQSNWYSFYQNGFSQTSHYTYIIDLTSGIDHIWNAQKNTVRTAIRQAQDKFTISESTDIKSLYKIQQKIFNRQNLVIPFNETVLTSLIETSLERKCGMLLSGNSENAGYGGGAFVVWDYDTAYLLILGAREKERKEGLVQLLIWEAIQRVAPHVGSFNFEGSMLPQVEPVFRHFGGVKTPYHIVSRAKNKVWSIVSSLAGKPI